MAKTPEGKVVDKIGKFLDKQEGDYYKVHGGMYQRNGEPDLTGSIKWWGVWLHFKFEVKAPKGESTRIVEPLQIYRLQTWHKCAKVVGVVRSVEDVTKLLEAYFDCHHDPSKGFLYYLNQVGIEDEYSLYTDSWEG